MNVKNKVIESQRRIIDALAESEIQVGRLYEKYAELFPEMKTHWLGLATAEKTHHDLLKTMHRILDKGSLFFNLGKFSDEVIQSMMTMIKESQEKAGLPGFTFADAIAAALKIESSIMDSRFYDIVNSDAPEFKIIAAKLSSDTKKHVKEIRNHFEQNFG